MPTLWGTLIITVAGEPDNVLEVRPLDRATLSIGQAPGNDIRPPLPGIAQHHALVHFDQQGVRVTNFSDSWCEYTNGVERSFPPGETVPLPQHAQLTIGPIALSVRLTPAAQDQAPPQASVPVPLKAQLIGHHFVVEPGTSLAISAQVTNLTARTALVWATAIGLPEGWNVRPSNPLGLDTETSQTARNSGVVTVEVEPPPVPTTTARDYEFALKISSDVSGGAPDLELNGRLTVLPYIEYAPRLRPERLRVWRRGRFRLLVENNSNWNLPLTLEPENSEEALRWRLVSRRTGPHRWRRQPTSGPTTIVAPCGERTEWELRTWPRRRPLFGRERAYPFTLTIAPDLTISAVQAAGIEETGLPRLRELARTQSPIVAPRQLKGELLHRPLPWWLPLGALAVVVLLLLLRFPQLPQSVAHRLARRPTTMVSGQPLRLSFAGSVVSTQSRGLSFASDGRIVRALEGCDAGGAPCPVQTGQLIAALDLAEANEALAAAERNLEQAMMAGQQAAAQQERDEAEALQKLQAAEIALGRLISGGRDDVFAADEAELREAQRARQQATDQAAAAVFEGQSAAEEAYRALEEAQRQYAVARDQAQWVRQRGTHPTESIPDPTDIEAQPIPRPLTPLEIQQFIEKEASAKRTLADKERAYVLALEAAKRAQTEADHARGAAEERVAELESRLRRLNSECKTYRQIGDTYASLVGAELLTKLKGCSDERLSEALSNVLTAGHAYDTVRARSEGSAGAAAAAIADAEAAVRLAQRRAAAGELRAPGPGSVIMLAPTESEVSAGEAVATFIPADAAVELAAALTPEHARLLRPGSLIAFVVGDEPVTSCIAADVRCYTGRVRTLPAMNQADLAPSEQVARFTLVNPSLAPPLTPGGAVHILAPIVPPTHAVWLPERWIGEGAGGPQVIVRHKWLDYTVPVMILARSGDQVQVRPLSALAPPRQPATALPPDPRQASFSFNLFALGQALQRSLTPLLGADEHPPLRARTVIVAP